MTARRCWRCGAHIDNRRDVPTCDDCLVHRDERMSIRERAEKQRRNRQRRLDAHELEAVRRRIEEGRRK